MYPLNGISGGVNISANRDDIVIVIYCFHGHYIRTKNLLLHKVVTVKCN